MDPTRFISKYFVNIYRTSDPELCDFEYELVLVSILTLIFALCIESNLKKVYAKNAFSLLLSLNLLKVDRSKKAENIGEICESKNSKYTKPQNPQQKLIPAKINP